MKKPVVIAIVIGLTAFLAGCAPIDTSAGEPTSSPVRSSSPDPAPSETATSTPVADYTVLGFDAQSLWNQCQEGVVAQNEWMEDTHPGITTIQPLTADGVRDAQDRGRVQVVAPSAVLQDGKPLAIWICEFSGEPASPHLEYASISDR